MVPFLQLKSLYQERVWGGRALETLFGRSLTEARFIGESWEIVDRPEIQSVVQGGFWDGRMLRDVIAAHAAQIMGPAWPADKLFPILVKLLDCRERLSLQVHPPASIAAKLGGEPKTENWYFLKTESGAAVLAGLKTGVDVEQFCAALEDNTAEKLVDRLPTRAGNSLLIPSGVIHAIDAGNVILEIQQNSDTTYRVYDWGRMGLDGKPRPLHGEQSLTSVAANTEPTPVLLDTATDRERVLADCAEFRIRLRRLAVGQTLIFPAREQPKILSVVEGTLLLDGTELGIGTNIVLPHAGEFAATAVNTAGALITDNFTQLA